MTYPPQQPGQYGQSSYQGLGSYSGGSGEPPKKKNTGMIVAIVLIVVMVLGGGGVAVYFLTKDDDKGSNSASSDDKTGQKSSEDEPSDDKSTDDASNDDDNNDNDDSGDANNSPDDVRTAYMDAYESKDFVDVVNSSCAAYKSKFGTDTTELETTLEDYDINATADGEPEVNGNTATAKIDLELASAGTTERPKILIKIVEEDGEWRFCGEGKA